MDESGLTSQPMATAEAVARAGYEALRAGDAIEVPTPRAKLLWHLTRLLPKSRAAKLSADFWEG